jgi:hypothetical protein
MSAVRKQLVSVAIVRTLYGLAALFAPRLLSGPANLPDLEPDERYFNGLFGGRDLTVAGLTVAALQTGREREAVLANLSCEATDLVALGLEIRRRGGVDRVTGVGIVFSAFGLLGWLDTARRAHA